jgi:uncharacterized Tic20 family protein
MANKDEPSQQAENTAGDKPAATAQGREVGKKARQWAMFCHIAGLAWMVWWLAPVIGGVIGTLIVWQVKKDDDPFIDQHGRRAFNFQLSMLIYAVALCLTVIGVFLVPVVGILDIVFTIIAAIRASDGKDYQYPLTIPFIK